MTLAEELLQRENRPNLEQRQQAHQPFAERVSRSFQHSAVASSDR